MDQSKLICANYDLDEMKELFHADSLRFLRLEDFEEVLGDSICTACMSGRYFGKLYDYDPGKEN